MFTRILLFTAANALSLASAAHAQATERRSPAPKTDWAITVGAAPVYAPVFQGAKEYGFSVFPDVRVNYKDDFFASVPEGMGYNIINNGGWKIGPLAKIRFGREEGTGGSPFLISGESNALRGLGNVETAGEIGGFAQYSYEKIRTRVELRQGFGGHEGVVGDANVSYVDRAGPLSYSIGPRLSYGSADFMNTYYGINATQSARSGLARYDADGGINSYGIGGSATMPIDDSMAVTLFAGYDRMGEQAADSSLIRERGNPNQMTVGLAFGYRFGWND